MKRHTQNREEQLRLSNGVEPTIAETFYVTQLPDAIAKGARFNSRKSYRETHHRAIPIQHSFNDEESF